jgi:hypothetical protein
MKNLFVISSLIYFSQLFVSPAQAVEQALIDVLAEHQATVDGINLNSLHILYQNHRRDLFWPYPGEKNESVDLGARAVLNQGTNPTSDYYGYSGSVLLGRKFSQNSELDAEIGEASLLNTRNDQRQNILIGQIEERQVVGKKFDSDVILKRDFIYLDLMQPGAVSEFIAAISAYANLQYHLSESWRLLSRSSYRWLSDANRRVETDLAIMYGISTGVPWIWVGVGGDYLSFQTNRNVYWSPLQFYSFGPRVEVSTPLFGDFSLNVGANLNSQTELRFIPGTGYYAVASLDYGSRERVLVRLSYTRIQSYQGSNQWNDDGIALSFQAPL